MTLFGTALEYFKVEIDPPPPSHFKVRGVLLSERKTGLGPGVATGQKGDKKVNLFIHLVHNGNMKAGINVAWLPA